MSIFRSGKPSLYYRHRLPVRIMHWINVLAFFLLLMSGLQIFNAYPELAWGKSSYTGRPPLMRMEAVRGSDGRMHGVTRVLGYRFETTGLFGLSTGASGKQYRRAFPEWATIPGPRWLSMARHWHFFFAWVFVINGLCYLLWSIFSGHFSRNLLPDRNQLRGIGGSIRDHLLLRHPKGEAAKHYNVLQKLAYLSVIVVFIPLIIIMGWAMSPNLDSVIPGWVDLVGGRQSARTIHFIAAWLVVAFVLVHVFEVVVTGPWNNLRSMITGRYRVPPEEDSNAKQ
jgi:thiosulfate reductase cytochrome b subunit